MAMTVLSSLLIRARQYGRENWKRHLRTLTLMLAILVAVQTWQTRGVPGGLAPDFELVLLQPDGSATKSTLQAWRSLHPGQPVALHFWADWCPICRTEENSITRLAADAVVLTIAMQSGTPAKVHKVLQTRNLSWPAAVDESGNATHAFGFKAVPAFVVVDSNGYLRTPTMGYTTEMGMRFRLWWADLIKA